MELIQGLIQPPKVQTVDDTIPTLCDRVENATLLSDRRSAVLGLKSFSRSYRETVIASGLKPLITTLKKDAEDEDSVKAILETLLILFIRGEGNADLTRNWISQESRVRNGKYPSPLVMKQEQLENESVDQFSLWIADFMTQTDELVHLFVRLLEVENFHIKLYTIQLLEAFIASRASRTREAIISLPVGVSTLVGLLEDVHDPIRDEAVLLLMALVNNSAHIQHLVAFENIFEKLFNILQEEGGLRGSLVVSDCLTLILNILKYNTSNQILFVETGNLPQMAKLLNDPMEGEFHWNDQRVLNIRTGLTILMLSVDPDNNATPKHQKMLLEAHLLMISLKLALSPTVPNSVRPFALLAAADMIRDNDIVQSELQKIDVPSFDPSTTTRVADETRLVSVIELVMNWCFFANSIHTFEIRRASSELVKAYLKNNQSLQLRFVTEQINIYEKSDHLDDDADAGHFMAGIFNVILEYDPDLKLNPYKLYFASDLLFFLLQGDSEPQIREIIGGIECKGFESMDEVGETMSPVQTILELLLTSLTLEDSRVSISYLCLLIYWLFDDPTAVNSFLSDKTVLQSLIAYTSQMKEDDVTVNCLVSVLLGVSYEFSSKQSKVTRAEYYELLVKSVGVNNYMSKIRQLQENSLFTDSETEENFLGAFETDSTGLPKIYFSPFFTRLLRENFYQIQTALKRGPTYESVVKVSFESFEDLRQEKVELEEELSKLEKESKKGIEEIQASLQEAAKQLNETQEQNKQRASELTDKTEKIASFIEQEEELKRVLAALREEHKDLVQDRDEKKSQISGLEEELSAKAVTMQKLEKDLKSATTGRKSAEDGINKMNRELFTLSKENDRLKTESSKATAELESKLKSMRNDLQKLETKKNSFEEELGITALNLKKLSEDKKKAEFESNSLQKEQADLKSRLKNQEDLVSKLSTKLRELVETCKQLSESKAEKDAEIDTLATRNLEEVSKLENELKNVQDQLKITEDKKQSLGEEIKSLNSTSNERDEKYRTLSQQNEGLTRRLKMYSDSLSEIKTFCSGLRKEVSNIPVRDRLLYERLQQLQDDNVQKFKKMLGTMDGYKAQVVSSENKRKVISESFEKLQTVKSELEARVENSNAERIEASNALSKQTTDHEKQIQSKLDKISSLERKLAELEKERDEAMKSSKKLQSELVHLQEKCEALKLSREALSKSSKASALKAASKVSSLEKKYAQLSEDYERCQVEQERSIAVAKAAESNALNLEKKIEDANASLQEQKSVADTGELKLSKFKSDLDAAHSEVDTKDAELKNTEASLVELRDSFASLEIELGNLKTASENEKRHLSEEVERLKHVMKEKKAELEEERKLLAEGSMSDVQNYLKKISDLEAKLESLEHAHAEKLGKHEEIKSELENLLKKSKEQGSAKAKELEEVNQKLVKVLNSQEENKVSYRKLEESQRLENVEAASRTKELNSTIEQKEKDMTSLKLSLSTTESTVASLKQKIADYVAQITKLEESDNSLKLCVKSAEKSLDKSQAAANAAKDQSNEQIRQLEESIIANNVTVNKLNSDLKIKNETLVLLENQMIELVNTTEVQQQRLKKLEEVESSNVNLAKELESTKDENKAAVVENRRLREVNESLSEKLKRCENDQKNKSDYDDKDKLAKELSMQVEHLKLEVKDWKSKASDRSEVDDLMLLVSELDEKNSKYRAKLELLGNHFSSDEEEEDDDTAGESK
ncbi:Uso1p LALA0_S01e10660g [Lachancea lanzarotensis]|uniref:LALA0S01e10660g1_1 n=1 Tax=Lachancea lanzarotensis TaxID=1245769 RepID=A0A0C7MKW0_9SACH|nr:uncharacterized protein LALA0_S01e10660g [Lachancea lanzarotensis]CEP60428.1 LALA0S01e10660g1_1 [Lachancea lanzarotensis]